MSNFKKGDKITTIYGDKANVVVAGDNLDELTKLDRDVLVGHYSDGVPIYSPYIITYEIVTYEIGENK